MTKPELGTKRLCAGCNAKFYDLLKTPDRLPDLRGGVRRAEGCAVTAAARLRAAAGGIAAIVAAPAIELESAKDDDAPATGETADGEKEPEGGVALLKRSTRIERSRAARDSRRASLRQFDDLVHAFGGIVDRHLHDGMALLDDQAGGLGRVLGQ